MSEILVMEVKDSHKNSRCSVLWRWGGESSSYYALKLSYAIGSLNDDSTTEEIIRNIREEFPEIGIPRNVEFYKKNNLAMTDYIISTRYADDLELPDGNTSDGIIAVTYNSVSEFSEWAETLLYFELGNVKMEDCVFDEELESFLGLYAYDRDSEEYRNIEEEIREVRENAYVISEEEFKEPITPLKQRDRLMRIINTYEWIRHGNDYYHIECF